MPAKIALFVDLENVHAHFIAPAAEFASSQGQVCQMAVFADWRKGWTDAWHKTLELGGVPKLVVKSAGKNSADISIVIDAIELLYTAPEIDTFILASCDSDFAQLAQKLRSRGKTVLGIAPAGSSAAKLLQTACDRFVYLSRDDDDEGDEVEVDVEDEILPRTDDQPSSREPTDVLVRTRAALRTLLADGKPVRGAYLGIQLREAVAGFSVGDLGFRTLSDFLRGQSDLVEVTSLPDGISVLLNQTQKTPAAKPTDFKALRPAQRNNLRDLLIAVLLDPGIGRDDDAIVKEMRARAGDNTLPPFSLGEIIGHYPLLFSRNENGEARSLSGLVNAYELQLGRFGRVDRPVLRRCLRLIADIISEDPSPRAQATLAELMGAQSDEPLERKDARTTLSMLLKAKAWRAAGAAESEGGPKTFVAEYWVQDPSLAEDRIDQAILRSMRYFRRSLNPVLLALVLGDRDRAEWLAAQK